MNALTLPASRSRKNVVILSALNLAPKSPTMLSRLARSLRQACTLSAINTAVASVASMAAFFGGILEQPTLMCSGAVVSCAAIFFIAPAIEKAARKGGAR